VKFRFSPTDHVIYHHVSMGLSPLGTYNVTAPATRSTADFPGSFIGSFVEVAL